jgi:hypothetical protein
MKVETAVSLLLATIAEATKIATAIGKAQSEGRDLTDAEIDSIAGSDDEARSRLQAKIDAL